MIMWFEWVGSVMLQLIFFVAVVAADVRAGVVCGGVVAPIGKVAIHFHLL